MTHHTSGAADLPDALRPVELGALIASIQELNAWESRADGELLTQAEGESIILVLHELKRLIALAAGQAVASAETYEAPIVFVTPEEIQAEWDAFIDYPEGSDKLYVTTTSALIFARTIVATAMSRANLEAVRGSPVVAGEVVAHQCEPQYAISDDGWTEYVCPKPESYLMQCCDCGLVHGMQFRVARYSDLISEDFEVVSDKNLQAQFRARRVIQAQAGATDEAEIVCAEAYQVVGVLLNDLGIFDTERAEKILDNLSQAKLVHKDVLPWESTHQAPTADSVPAVDEAYKQVLWSKNCMQCCVGYMLGLPLESVPDFAADGGWDRFASFAESQGYAAVMIPGNPEFEADYLASGTTARGTSHMVVMNDGKLVHDPHPSNAGLVEVQCVWLLAKKAGPQWHHDERAAFEASAKAFTSNVSFERDGTDYADMTASLLWHGWKLRAARSPADSVLEDAARYQLVRRGQHWSVIDGIGNDLRGEALDAAVDTVRSKKGGAA